MAAFSKGHKKAGGRKAGVPNKSTVQARELAKIAERKGLTPLDILLGNAERFYQLELDAQANDKSEDEIIYRGWRARMPIKLHRIAIKSCRP